MAVRAARWAILGVLWAVAAAAGERPATPPPADSLPIATDVRLGGAESQTRFVMDLSRSIELHAFTLADPYRVVLDIPQVTFKLPPAAGESGHGLIKAFRFGLVMPGGSRMVFDLARPARVEKAFVVDAADGEPARLVLDLVATDRESFLRRVALESRPKHADPPHPVEAPAASVDPRPLVALDPGHGGIDTGTKSSDGKLEKDIVLDFAQRLHDRIEKTGKYRVLMTRNDDTFVPLATRVRIAREAGAALFVSIHADALPRREGEARGASVYTLSETATDSESARLAENENRADVIAGVDLKSEPDDVADILIDLAQRETKGFSLQFARKLVGAMKGTMRLHKNPLKSAGFRVLRAPDVPSALVELGYVSNRQDLELLASEKWRDRTAGSIAVAIESFLATRVANAHAGAN